MQGNMTMGKDKENKENSKTLLPLGCGIEGYIWNKLRKGSSL
jgi:hypothetical protein